MHQQRQGIVTDSGKQVDHSLARAAQPPHARALRHITGRKHAAGDVQGKGNAVLQMPGPSVSAPKQSCLAVTRACTAPHEEGLVSLRIQNVNNSLHQVDVDGLMFALEQWNGQCRRWPLEVRA